MKLKQKERYVSETLKELATSKIFFAIIICEIISAVGNFSKLFIKEVHPNFSNNSIINTSLVLLTVLCVLAYSIAEIVCYININRYFKGKTDKLFGLQYLYKVHLIGAVVGISCVFISLLPQAGFEMFYIGTILLIFTVYVTIIYFIYSSLIRNTIECAEFAANGFIRGKIGNGIVVFMVVIFISQVISLFSSPIFKFFEYDSISTWLKLSLASSPTLFGLISIILYFILLLKFKRAFNTK